MIRPIFLFAVLLMSSAQASASCSQTGNKLVLTGLDFSKKIYAGISSDSPKNCGCGAVRFSPNTTDTSEILSVLLAAKVSGKTVRIDINVEGNCDSGVIAYVE